MDAKETTAELLERMAGTASNLHDALYAESEGLPGCCSCGDCRKLRTSTAAQHLADIQELRKRLTHADNG